MKVEDFKIILFYNRLVYKVCPAVALVSAVMDDDGYIPNRICSFLYNKIVEVDKSCFDSCPDRCILKAYCRLVFKENFNEADFNDPIRR